MAAVFPVVSSGDFDTNPSYSGGFIPQVVVEQAKR